MASFSPGIFSIFLVAKAASSTPWIFSHSGSVEWANGGCSSDSVTKYQLHKSGNNEVEYLHLFSPPLDAFSGIKIDKVKINPNGQITFFDRENECDTDKRITFTGLQLDTNKFDDVEICVDTIEPGQHGKFQKQKSKQKKR